MKFYSTNEKIGSPKASVSLKEAVMKGLAPDGGLFVPDEIPRMDASFFESMDTKTFQDISFEVAKNILGKDIPEDVLNIIIQESFNFDIPFKKLDEKLYVLELFHGPTLAFKDFAARFMARIMSYFLEDSEKELTILVATSGDTGSAVASAFFGVPKIKVIILYPSRRISYLQEKQLTTYNGNITALEITGSFDDCQRLVKEVFLDKDINTTYNLGSANSINIMRLLPQTFYYFYAYAQLKKQGKKNNIIISVPSGNLGNLTAAVFAKKMGLPIGRLIVSGNINNRMSSFLETGVFESKISVQTISNAMDVGNPSNFIRLLEIYGSNIKAMREDLKSYVFTDEETRQAIKEIYDKYGYIMDPHGAVGYLGLQKFQKESNVPSDGVFIETAHPIKFSEIVESIIKEKIKIPKGLEELLKKEKIVTPLSANLNDFKRFLLRSKD